ncbi:MAG: zinc-binding alcohol dehydrogenase family protein [Candidatus Hydrogenedentes bacterium]|nr:zinc-binding alcohol dehydrogenase family protein [Candidatus Hydrogenedentota bacterium]
MRAWRFHEFGDLANYTLEEVPEPVPGDGEVLIRTRYASLNPADRLLIEGKYPGAGDLPLTVGRDGSGTIEKAAEGSRFKVGDEVIVLRSEIGITRQGTLAECVATPDSVVAHLPKGWSLQEGAAAPLVYLTAWKALVVQGRLRKDQSVLVTGASGGVGIASIQLAKALGAKVVALSRSEEKRGQLKELGADEALDDGAPDLPEKVRAALNGKGPDVIIENLGGARLDQHIGMANLNARIMVIGLLAGRMSEINMGQVLFKQVRIEGVHVGKLVPTQAQDGWRRIVDTLGAANARPVIDRIFPMEQVQEAFAQLAGGHLGKVLVEVQS